MSGGTEGDSSQAESSSGSASSDSSTVEVKIRTLDSASHSIRVNKDISVPALKQQLEPLVGVPAQEQRLICRGKVLKDDQLLSAYNVEDGHTLHLVARPQTQSQPAEPQGEQANAQGQTDPNQMGRPGQVTHSLLVGTINVPTVGDGVPDFNRIVSAVLGSVGNLPGQNAPVDMQQAAGQALPPRLGLSFGGGNQLGFQVPSDALTTMAIYLSRLEQMFGIAGAPVQNQNQPPSQSLNQTSNQSLNQTPNQTSNPPVNQSPPPPPASDDPSAATQRSAAVSRPSMSPAALGAIIRRAQSLLTGQGAALLNALAGQLENEVSLTDVNMRGEVHAAAAWSGTVMQQLGALLMELGRTTLTLHMGSAPGEALVNSGPAVFLSPSGPNPMMVQPIPFQPIGAFPARASFPSAGWPSAPGPRSLNIHIHTSDVGISPTANASSVPPSAHNGSQVPMPGTGGQENSLEAMENNSEAMPSAVVQETIMVIQDNGDARVLSSRATNLSSETTTPPGMNSTTEGNSSVPMQAGSTAQMAQVSQALRQLWPEGFRPPQQLNGSLGSNPLSSMLGATLGQLTGMHPGLPSQGQPAYNPFVAQQGATPALAQAQVSMPHQPATVPPPQPSASDASAMSLQPTSDSSSGSRDALKTTDPAANTSATATNSATSPAQPNTSLPAGLGLGRLRPLVPRRRADASSQNERGDSPRSRAPPAPPAPPVGESNLSGLIGTILRNPAFGNFAQQMMQSLGEGGPQHSADVGSVLSQIRGAVQQQQQPTNVDVPDANDAQENESIKTQNSSESTLQKLESGAPAGEVTRSVVEAAATNAAIPFSEAELSELASDLSDDYIALILQDLASRL